MLVTDVWAGGEMMAESFQPLILATLVFVGSHLLLSATPVRRPLVAVLGRGGFIACYSAVALASFAWMCLTYRRAPFVDFWPLEGWMYGLSIAVTLVAAVLLASGYLAPNPASVIGGPAAAPGNAATGILAVTRHPVLWAIALWALAHMLVTGDAASLIFFSAIAGLALLGARHIDARRDLDGGAEWIRFREKTSLVPFAAMIRGRAVFRPVDLGWRQIVIGLVLWIVLVQTHEWVIGVIVAPWAPAPAMN